MISPRANAECLISGSGMSFLSGDKSGGFSYGYCSFKGKRATMEDTFETSISDVDGHMVALFGVFDGHGGSHTAQYLKIDSFEKTDSDYLIEAIGQTKDSGSTASTAILLDDHLLVANVGDSRVVACKEDSAIPLSNDHKPDRSDERKRIENTGGFILWAGTWRVGGVLSVSRAFGNKQLKNCVIAVPEIQGEEINGIKFIIIATDGLWNVVSDEEAVAIVQRISDAEASARKLVEEAYSKGSADNITCIVVRFQKPSGNSLVKS